MNSNIIFYTSTHSSNLIRLHSVPQAHLSGHRRGAEPGLARAMNPEGTLRPVPDFQRLHQKWEKAQEKAHAKAPLTVPRVRLYLCIAHAKYCILLLQPQKLTQFLCSSTIATKVEKLLLKIGYRSYEQCDSGDWPGRAQSFCMVKL